MFGTTTVTQSPGTTYTPQGMNTLAVAPGPLTTTNTPDLKGLESVLGLFGLGAAHRPNIDTGLQAGPQPTISTGPVIGQDLLQQQINSARAGIAGQTATGKNQLASSMAARGMDSSPALMAMQSQLGSRGLGQQYQAENQMRLGAAERNAGQVLNSQNALAQANEAAFGNRQHEQIQRQQAALSPFQGLFGSIMQGLL